MPIERGADLTHIRQTRKFAGIIEDIRRRLRALERASQLEYASITGTDGSDIDLADALTRAMRTPWKDDFIVTATSARTYRLSHLPVDKSVNFSLNGVELLEGVDYTVNLDTGDVVLAGTVTTVAGSDPDVLTADYWTPTPTSVADPAPPGGTLSIPLRRAAFTYGPTAPPNDNIVIGGVIDNTNSYADQQVLADGSDTSYVWFQQPLTSSRQDHYFFLDDPPQPPAYPTDATFTAARLLVRYQSNVHAQMTLITRWEHPAGTPWATVQTTGFDLPAAASLTDLVLPLAGQVGTVGDNLPFTPETLQITYPTGWASPPWPVGYVGGAVSFEIVGNDTYAGGGLTIAPALPVGADVRIAAITLELDWTGP